MAYQRTHKELARTELKNRVIACLAFGSAVALILFYGLSN